MTVKETIREMLDGLPDDVTIHDVIERLYLLQKVAEGLRQADAGDVMDHDEFERETRNWSSAGQG